MRRNHKPEEVGGFDSVGVRGWMRRGSTYSRPGCVVRQPGGQGHRHLPRHAGARGSDVPLVFKCVYASTENKNTAPSQCDKETKGPWSSSDVDLTVASGTNPSSTAVPSLARSGRGARWPCACGADAVNNAVAAVAFARHLSQGRGHRRVFRPGIREGAGGRRRGEDRCVVQVCKAAGSAATGVKQFVKANLVGTNFAKQCQEHVVSSQACFSKVFTISEETNPMTTARKTHLAERTPISARTGSAETCTMQRRTSKAGVVTATCLLILVSISPVSADIGVRAAPRPSSDPSDTVEKSVLAPRSAAEVHADRLVSQRPTHRRRTATRDQAASRRVRRPWRRARPRLLGPRRRGESCLWRDAGGPQGETPDPSP